GVRSVPAFINLMALVVRARQRDRGGGGPGEMSVVGFEDVRRAAMFSPALTSVHAPLARLGGRDVDLLLARLRDSAPASAQLPVELVVRGSSGPAPAGAGT